jgi:hypothetical protein
MRIFAGMPVAISSLVCVKASAEFHLACFEGFIFKVPLLFSDRWVWIRYYVPSTTTTPLQQQQICVSGRVFNLSSSLRRR